ncbi:MAG: ABC transporter ATP-binding protein [Taibaiella sp.]|nr:ABC transporter ATP-binding protein [Taibaiella sp.]
MKGQLQFIKAALSILTPRERKRYYQLALVNLAISIADIASLAGLVFVIAFYTHPVSIYSHYHIPQVLSDNRSLLPIAIITLLFAIKNTVAYYTNQYQTRYIYSIASRLSYSNLINYLEGDYTSYIATDSSENLRLICQAPAEYSQYILAGMQQIFTEVVLSLFTIMAILVFSPSIFTLLFVFLVPATLIVAYFSRRRLKKARQDLQLASARVHQHLWEAINGYVESNLYDKHDFFADRYIKYQKRLNAHLSDMQSVQGGNVRIIELFAVAGLFVLIALHVSSSGGNWQGIISITAFIAAAYKVIPGIVRTINMAGQVKTYRFTVTDMGATMQREKISEQPLPISTIEFRNVLFGYPQKKVLKDISMVINKGDFAGIVGHSGIGKTTLFNLLLGFLEQEDGDILINNKATDITERKAYRRSIGYIKQQPFYIHDTLLTNIVLDDHVYDEERLNRVIQLAGLGELMSGSNGLKMEITENGKNISGGQRQRLALARALYKDADILILDEPFSELDEAAEKEMLEVLKGMTTMGKTILLVTHNNLCLSYCNKIISLDV